MVIISLFIECYTFLFTHTYTIFLHFGIVKFIYCMLSCWLSRSYLLHLWIMTTKTDWAIHACYVLPWSFCQPWLPFPNSLPCTTRWGAPWRSGCRITLLQYSSKDLVSVKFWTQYSNVEKTTCNESSFWVDVDAS